MPRRRRQSHGLERVLGTPSLFATAYGNVGSSIYYALGVTAAIALGLTPLVFVISGLIFACTAATYAEGTVLFPEAYHSVGPRLLGPGPFLVTGVVRGDHGALTLDAKDVEVLSPDEGTF